MTSVAIQGIYGSYSEEAACKMLGDSIRLIECRDFSGALAALRDKGAAFAVMPLRNKIVGEIGAVTALLANDEFATLDRLRIDIEHVLAGTSEAELKDLETVRSHPEALKQCTRYLAANAHLRTEADADTASSIRHVIAEGSPRHAAICSERAAAYYQARVLRRDIANEKDNWTDFGLVARK